MNKENISQEKNEVVGRVNDGTALLAITSTFATLVMIASYISARLDNNLTDVRDFMSDSQAQNAMCGDDLSQCELVSARVCDGQNTWDRSDDVCEDINFLRLIPVPTR
jgi:hypothetical protein